MWIVPNGKCVPVIMVVVYATISVSNPFIGRTHRKEP